jgi:hypothetical protein
MFTVISIDVLLVDLNVAVRRGGGRGVLVSLPDGVLNTFSRLPNYTFARST